MASHTMAETIEGLTPYDIRSMRSVHGFVRRMMTSDNFRVDLKEGSEFEITLMAISIGDTRYIYDPNQRWNAGYSEILGNIYLAAQSVLWGDPEFGKWIKQNRWITKPSVQQVEEAEPSPKDAEIQKLTSALYQEYERNRHLTTGLSLLLDVVGNILEDERVPDTSHEYEATIDLARQVHAIVSEGSSSSLPGLEATASLHSDTEK